MSQTASKTQSVHVVLGTAGGVLAIGAIAVVSMIVSVVIAVVVHMRRKQKSIPVEKGGLCLFVSYLWLYWTVNTWSSYHGLDYV